MLRVEGADLELGEAVRRRGVDGGADVVRPPVAAAEEAVPDLALPRPEPGAVGQVVFAGNLTVAVRIRHAHLRAHERGAVLHVAAQRRAAQRRAANRKRAARKKGVIQRVEERSVALAGDIRHGARREKVCLDLHQLGKHIHAQPRLLLHTLRKLILPLNLAPLAGGEQDGEEQSAEGRCREADSHGDGLGSVGL